MMLVRTIRVSLLAAVVLVAAGAQAQLYSEPKAAVPMGKPESILKVGIDQHLNQQLPLDLRFRDENGAEATLGQYFGSKPVILTMVYYTCPMLCGEVQSGLVSALGILRFDASREFDVISVSINPNEPPTDAMARKKQFLSPYHPPGPDKAWLFLPEA